MPRTRIDLPYHVERLSILDETGKVDTELAPELPDEMLLKIHRYMLLTRRFDERLLALQRQGRIGTFAPVTGQEAAQLGTVAPLRASDWMAPAFREAAAELWRGRSLESFILYYGGFDEGGKIEESRNDLPISVPVGSQTLHAVGISYGIKYRGKDDVVVTFFGDGATSEGDFHEAMNFAGVYQTPTIFVCQNNQWAISVPRSRQSRSQTLAQKALAYGFPGIQVDGNDVLAVYSAASEAIERARKGQGPTMIECETYRMLMHTTADDPKRYRLEEDVEPWKARDPILRFQKYLASRGLLTEEEVQGLEEEIKTEIRDAVSRAEELMETLGDPLGMFEHTLEEMPDTLKEQREELIQELEAVGKEASHG